MLKNYSIKIEQLFDDLTIREQTWKIRKRASQKMIEEVEWVNVSIKLIEVELQLILSKYIVNEGVNVNVKVGVLVNVSHIK